MVSIFTWAKNNKLTTSLLICVFILLLIPLGLVILFIRSTASSRYYGSPASDLSGVANMMYTPTSKTGSYTNYSLPPPQPEVQNRMVVQDTQLSLLVQNVSDSLAKIQKQVSDVRGYVVNTRLNKPEEGDTGNVVMRVPAGRLDDTLVFLRTLAVKVVSENLQGQDVTDQYVDNKERLRILTSNKARFEEIMAKATNVDEILRVQQEIFNLQSQIDQITGQQKYLDTTSRTVLITVYIATDELALPFAPSNAWRPEVIARQAIRSLITSLRGLGSLLIWIGVYSVIWVPVVLFIKYLRRRKTFSRKA